LTGPRIVVGVLAHNEERRIGACLASLPLGDPAVDVHVVVNGSSDRTAEIARGFAGVTVHDWPQGGKARSWNRFALDTPGIAGDVFVFVDGDAEVAPGSIAALAEALADPAVNAAAAMPMNGRRAGRYRAEMAAGHGLFGDLYALSGGFVARLRASGIRLPEDLIGDDSLIGALAKTDLGDESDWREARLRPVAGAGFLCEPTRLSPASLRGQYRRMINYSVRHFQNRIVSAIMRGEGPRALPARMADAYPEWLGRFRPRAHPAWWWFDRQALARMRAAAG
jgi:glycosyltransferase involved in cell wall biosynthesis